MTYQSPGLLRRSAFSAAAGSISSAGVSTTCSVLTSCRSTASPADGLPSNAVTVLSPLCHLQTSAEHQQDQLGQTQVGEPDQRHHESQKCQHHRGVGDHLFAVRPNHLPHLGNDLLEVVVDECDRVNGTGLGGSGLLGL